MLSWGGTDFIQGFQLANQTKFLQQQIKWATDWLIKAHPTPTTLYVQVGDIDVDNNSFGPDTDIPEPRPCYNINEQFFGTDAAAMAAVAFSSASMLFNKLSNVTGSNATNNTDTNYANTLMTHATELYNAARNIRPYKLYQTSIFTSTHVYSSSDYFDELLLASLSMYRATGNSTYLEHLFQMFSEVEGLDNHTEPLDWDNKWGAFYVLLAETMLDHQDRSQAIQAREGAEKYLDSIVDGTTANKTRGGLLFWDGYSNLNSNSVAMSTSYLLLYYAAKVLHPLADRGHEDGSDLLRKAKSYQDLAQSQLDYVFGMNPIHQNYVVGERPNSPRFPHSAPASGFTSLAEAAMKAGDRSHAKTIHGALVGGPAADDTFNDVLLDWSQTEIALDYNAPYQNLLAYQVMYNSDGPFYLRNENDNKDNPLDTPSTATNNKLQTWRLGLAILFPLLTALSIAAGGIWYLKRRQKIRNIDGKAQQIKTIT
ncbi:Six-hairpin glycosidase-like protein [Mycotypha africana]|uniref:Six-hairpin glycosidase-like protein n=1 Tax=Mycotypha africana TaxID=64632 RepID=UPI002300D0B6|nr:Six-hairpin glycosidase-like protein [Mycotypha africana]KAI8967592.1 Six-hairpin glycosidase-like protein [Mycotypha africana]